MVSGGVRRAGFCRHLGRRGLGPPALFKMQAPLLSARRWTGANVAGAARPIFFRLKKVGLPPFLQFPLARDFCTFPDFPPCQNFGLPDYRIVSASTQPLRQSELKATLRLCRSFRRAHTLRTMVPSAPLRALLVVSTAYFVAMSCAHWCVSKCRHDKLAGSSSRKVLKTYAAGTSTKFLCSMSFGMVRGVATKRDSLKALRVLNCVAHAATLTAQCLQPPIRTRLSLSVAVYAIFFATAASHVEAVPGALVALAFTVLGLAGVTRSTDLASAVGPGGGSYRAYVAQILSIAALLGVLSFLHSRQRAHAKPA